MFNPIIQIHRGRLLVLPGALLIALLLSQCTSLKTMDDFRRAREKANRGDGREVVSNIMGDIDDVDPSMHGVAIDTVAVVDGPEARDALFRMLDKPALRSPDTRRRILSHLIRRDEPGTVDELYERSRRNPSSLTGEVVEYFGMRRYTPAIPDIKRMVDDGRFVKEGIRALSMMREGDAEKFVLSIANNERHPGRPTAIQSLPRLMHPYYKKNARGMIRQLISQPPGSSGKEEYLAALHAAGGLGMQEDLFETLKEIHTKSPDPAVRSQALESMARMKGVDSYLMARDLRLPLAEKQSLLSLWKGEQGNNDNADRSSRSTYRRRVSRYDNNERSSRRKSRPTTRERRQAREKNRTATALPGGEPSPDIPGPGSRTVAEEEQGGKAIPDEPSDAEGRAYRAKVMETLMTVTPPKIASDLSRRVHNAFMSYADFNTPSAKFVIRSYRKAYGGDDAQIRRLLARGLNQPGSLGAVIRNVKTEYGSDAMRVYVIANLFALPRWQASILLEQFEKGTF